MPEDEGVGRPHQEAETLGQLYYLPTHDSSPGSPRQDLSGENKDQHFKQRL